MVANIRYHKAFERKQQRGSRERKGREIKRRKYKTKKEKRKKGKRREADTLQSHLRKALVSIL